MLTVSYDSIHTPYRQAPRSLAALPAASELVCGDVPSDRILGDNMLESMDREIGRLLASLGLATLDDDGVIRTEADASGNAQIPELRESNTMVVVVGDEVCLPDVRHQRRPLRRSGRVVADLKNRYRYRYR